MLTIGFLIVGIIGVQLLRGAVARERARSEWTKVMRSAMMSTVPIIAPTRIRSGAPVARVVIPSIRLDEVVVEGLSDRDLWAGPGHMPGTVLPGLNGNSVISAHRDRHFHRLDDVRIGDMIETQTTQMSVMWRVTERHIVTKDERVIFDSVEPRLTLTTCWPTRYLGSAPDRLLLIAVQVSVRERNAPVATPLPSAAAATTTPVTTAATPQ